VEAAVYRAEGLLQAAVSLVDQLLRQHPFSGEGQPRHRPLEALPNLEQVLAPLLLHLQAVVSLRAVVTSPARDSGLRRRHLQQPQEEQQQVVSGVSQPLAVPRPLALLLLPRPSKGREGSGVLQVLDQLQLSEPRQHLQVVSGLRRPLGQWVSNQRAEFSVAGRLQELRATRRPLGLWVRAEVEPLLEAWEAHKELHLGPWLALVVAPVDLDLSEAPALEVRLSLGVPSQQLPTHLPKRQKHPLALGDREG